MSSWNALQSSPLLWIFITLMTFYIGQWIYQRSGSNPFIPPILTSIVLIIGILHVSGTSYAVYMSGGQYLHILLAPVVVLLAVPLFQFFSMMRRSWFRISCACIAGSFTTVAVAVGLCEWLIGSARLSLSMMAKSVTTPVAITLAEQLGGIAAISSAFVIFTGLFAAVIIPTLFSMLRLDRPDVTGLALGVCGHAIGTSRANELGPQYSAYSALAMSLTATLHAIILPWLV